METLLGGPNTDPSGIDPSITANGNGDANYASNTQASIALADWTQYKQTFQPLEDYLASKVNNPAYTNSQLGQSQQNFQAGYQSSQGTYQRNLDRYGLTLTPDQRQAYNQLQDQTQSTGAVQAINGTKRQLKNQELTILGASSDPAYQSQATATGSK